MLRVNTKPRKRNSPRPAEKHCPQFLQWLRGRDCAFASSDCEGRLEAMHLDFAGDKGVGTKVSDRFALPSCCHHHHQQHVMGWNTFVAGYGLTKLGLLNLAEAYWRAWPGRIAWERKLSDG